LIHFFCSVTSFNRNLRFSLQEKQKPNKTGLCWQFQKEQARPMRLLACDMNLMHTCTCACSLCSWLLPKDKQTLNFVLNQLGTHEEQFLPVLDLCLEEQRHIIFNS